MCGEKGSIVNDMFQNGTVYTGELYITLNNFRCTLLLLTDFFLAH